MRIRYSTDDCSHHDASSDELERLEFFLSDRKSVEIFLQFFTAPHDAILFEENEENQPDLMLSSYWYTYITKHAHLSLSCLSILANQFDVEHLFVHDAKTEHFIVMNKK